MIKKYFVLIFMFILAACSSSEKMYEIPETKATFTSKDDENILNYLNDEIDNRNNLFDNLIKRASIYINNNKIEEALSDIEHAEKLNPNSGYAYFVKAQILKNVGKDQAISAAKNAEQLGYRTPDLYLLLADLYIQKGDKELANENLQIAESLYPENHKLFYYKGDFNLLVGDTSKAMGLYRSSLHKNPSYFEPYNKLINLYQRFNNKDSLAKIYKIALKRFPNKTVLLYQKAKMLEANEYEDSAKVVYLEYLEKEPKDVEARIHLANLYFNTKYFSRAYDQYKIVIDSLPKNDRILYLAAYSKEKMGDYDEAKNLYRKAWEIKPTDDLVSDIRRVDSNLRRVKRGFSMKKNRYNSETSDQPEEEEIEDTRSKFPTLKKIEPKKEIE